MNHLPETSPPIDHRHAQHELLLESRVADARTTPRLDTTDATCADLAVDTTIDHVLVVGDERLVRTLVMNLVSNAVRYNRPGGIQILATTQAGQPLRHRPTSSALNARAELLEQGGLALWQEFMDELRRDHLGSESPARSPSVRERLNAAYLAAINSS